MYEQLAAEYEHLLDGAPYAAWARYLADAWAGDPQGVRTVLDVCCGTGLLTAELVALGYEVTGVDGSAAMLARARDLLGPGIALVEAQLPALPSDTTFDAAVSTFDSLSHVPLDVCAATFAGVAERLRPAGWFVFDVHADAMLRTIAAAPLSTGHVAHFGFRIQSDVDVDARRCDTRIDLTYDDGRPPVSELHRLYFHEEGALRDALAVAGLRVVSVTDDYGPAPAGPQTLRATWVVRA